MVRNIIIFHARVHFSQSANRKHDGAIHYAKRNVFGWKEIKMSDNKESSENHRLLENSSYLDYSLIEHVAIDGPTTLQELTLPVLLPSSTTSEPQKDASKQQTSRSIQRKQEKDSIAENKWNSKGHSSSEKQGNSWQRKDRKEEDFSNNLNLEIDFFWRQALGIKMIFLCFDSTKMKSKAWLDINKFIEDVLFDNTFGYDPQAPCQQLNL